MSRVGRERGPGRGAAGQKWARGREAAMAESFSLQGSVWGALETREAGGLALDCRRELRWSSRRDPRGRGAGKRPGVGLALVLETGVAQAAPPPLSSPTPTVHSSPLRACPDTQSGLEEEGAREQTCFSEAWVRNTGHSSGLCGKCVLQGLSGAQEVCREPGDQRELPPRLCRHRMGPSGSRAPGWRRCWHDPAEGHGRHLGAARCLPGRS